MKKEEKIPVKETVAEMIKRIAKENNYEDVRLPETDLLGEDVAIVLRYDGLWSAQFSVGNSQAYFVYFDEKGELDYDHTVWHEFDTPEEALEALDEQCKEMKLRNAILISQDQMQGDGYYKDEDENDDNECDDDHENDEDLDALKNNLIELLKKQNPALSKLEEIETENELELKSMIGKLPDNWKEMSSEEKLATVYRKFDLLSDSDMYGLTLHGGFNWNKKFEIWLDLEADEDHQFTEMGACFALPEPYAKEEFDFNKFPEYLHPIIKAKCDDDYNILCTQSDSGTCAETAESMYFMLDLLAYGYELTEREWFYKKHPDLYPDSIDDEEDFDDEEDNDDF